MMRADRRNEDEGRRSASLSEVFDALDMTF